MVSMESDALLISPTTFSEREWKNLVSFKMDSAFAYDFDIDMCDMPADVQTQLSHVIAVLLPSKSSSGVLLALEYIEVLGFSQCVVWIVFMGSDRRWQGGIAFDESFS